MEMTIKHLQNLFPNTQGMTEAGIQEFIIDEILKTPYKRVEEHKVHKLMGENYVPGLFWVRERKEKPDFLLEESKMTLEQWLVRKLEVELEQLLKSEELSVIIEKMGKEAVFSHALNILAFEDDDRTRFLDKIINQEYSDIFRRILMLILVGDPLFIFNNHKEFNDLGKSLVPIILENTKQYDFRKRLYQSIASGLFGMDRKEKNISTAPASLKKNFYLDQDHIAELSKLLEEYIDDPENIGIDCFEQYFEEVINGKDTNIAWITDDYIQTIFELKFIEEQMRFNESLTFTVIPRYDTYSNDASYDDVMEMLGFDVLADLHNYMQCKRFFVCREGMDISTFDGYRMSEEVYRIIDYADIVVISGARAFEMSQGMNKVVYYTGIAVCKAYTESVTGFSKDSGKLIFLRQEKGEHSFEDFKMRSTRKMQTESGSIQVAGKTAKEYYEERYGASSVAL